MLRFNDGSFDGSGGSAPADRPFAVAIREAHETIQFGTGRRTCGLGALDVQLGLRGASLLREQVEVVDVARLMQTRGHLGAGGTHLRDGLQLAEDLLPGLRFVERRLRLRCEREDLMAGGALRLLEFAGRHLRTERREQPTEDIRREAELVIRAAAPAGETHTGREGGIPQRGSLHQFGVRDAHIFERGAQAAVIKQRQLHRNVRREGTLEQGRDACLGIGGFLR